MSHPQFGRFIMERTCQQVCNVLRVLGFLVLSAVSLAACAGVQSSLAPAGQAAERIAALFWWMTAGAALVWLGIMILAIYATKADGAHRQQQAQRIILLGAVLPTIVLAGLLGYGLHLLPQLIAPPQSALWESKYMVSSGGGVCGMSQLDVRRLNSPMRSGFQ